MLNPKSSDFLVFQTKRSVPIPTKPSALSGYLFINACEIKPPPDCPTKIRFMHSFRLFDLGRKQHYQRRNSYRELISRAKEYPKVKFEI